MCKVVILLIKRTVFDDLVTIACITGGFADEGNAGQRKQAANTLHARHAKAPATQTIVATAS